MWAVPEENDPEGAGYCETGEVDMSRLSVQACIGSRRLTGVGLLALVGLLFTACASGPADRADAVKMADVLKGKTKQDLLACAGTPRRVSTSEGLTAMVYQEEAELVELSVPGAKSSGARSVPHSCLAIVTLMDGRVTDVRFESVPVWLGAEDHCEEIFARCVQ
jgi:hypothetical protein